MVEDNRGGLVICGDLFELWQSNLSKVLTKRVYLLDRFARMGVVYVLGNHDGDLRYFMPHDAAVKLTHPFFQRMCDNFVLRRAGKRFYFTHGHLADQYCSSESPGIGRIAAIYAGLKEDKNGGPMLNKYRTVEDKMEGRLDKLVGLWKRLCGKPNRYTKINRKLKGWAYHNGSIIICGHTHFPGHISGWHYNTGTWAERTNSFVCINDTGTVGVFDWANKTATPNMTELPI
jgi:UDP-2,3-diacylglucosamine pyrophosphatase LpxH